MPVEEPMKQTSFQHYLIVKPVELMPRTQHMVQNNLVINSTMANPIDLSAASKPKAGMAETMNGLFKTLMNFNTFVTVAPVPENPFNKPVMEESLPIDETQKSESKENQPEVFGKKVRKKKRISSQGQVLLYCPNCHDANEKIRGLNVTVCFLCKQNFRYMCKHCGNSYKTLGSCTQHLKIHSQ
ncbi:uncharacterized protein LOC106638517 [Copidosoma floridanum]|uniref:uncharacterized protein LOC106638517 n=1 Tax=Copidosoma floridanum TaxID=29053 RepID=UPI0006C99065|nr:uncharacterized protein LOC106638517 [Copidosoma floridanum]